MRKGWSDIRRLSSLPFTRPRAGRAAQYGEGYDSITCDSKPYQRPWLLSGAGCLTPGAPLGAFNAQVWKSEQPGSSPFQSRQGTDAESGTLEEMALFGGNHRLFSCCGWESLRDPTLLGPSQQVFLGAERKRKMKLSSGNWLPNLAL